MEIRPAGSIGDDDDDDDINDDHLERGETTISERNERLYETKEGKMQERRGSKSDRSSKNAIGTNDVSKSDAFQTSRVTFKKRKFESTTGDSVEPKKRRFYIVTSNENRVEKYSGINDLLRHFDPAMEVAIRSSTFLEGKIEIDPIFTNSKDALREMCNKKQVLGFADFMLFPFSKKRERKYLVERNMVGRRRKEDQPFRKRLNDRICKYVDVIKRFCYDVHSKLSEMGDAPRLLVAFFDETCRLIELLTFLEMDVNDESVTLLSKKNRIEAINVLKSDLPVRTTNIVRECGAESLMNDINANYENDFKELCLGWECLASHFAFGK
jgi:hypothetical protein